MDSSPITMVMGNVTSTAVEMVTIMGSTVYGVMRRMERERENINDDLAFSHELPLSVFTARSPAAG